MSPGSTSAAAGVPETNQRQALAIALLGIAAVVISTFALLGLTRHSLDRVLFEAVSDSAPSACPPASPPTCHPQPTCCWSC